MFGFFIIAIISAIVAFVLNKIAPEYAKFFATISMIIQLIWLVLCVYRLVRPHADCARVGFQRDIDTIWPWSPDKEKTPKPEVESKGYYY
jgi:hypothetical protein